MSWTTTFRRPSRPQAAALVAVVAVIAISAGLALQPRPSSPGDSPGPGSMAPSSSPVAATGSPEPWAALTLPPIERAATLEPVVADPSGIAPDTGFILTSLTGEPAATMVARLEVSPAAALEVVIPADPGTAGDTVRIRPATSLAPN